MFGLWFCSSFFEQIASKRVKTVNSSKLVSFPVELQRSKTPSLKLPNKNRGTQRQFSENICSEDDSDVASSETFVVKFLACLPLLGFSNI